MLAPTRREGDDMLRELRAGGTCVTADLFRVTRFSDGGGSSNPLNSLRHGDQRNLLFTGRNPAAEIQSVSFSCRVLVKGQSVHALFTDIGNSSWRKKHRSARRLSKRSVSVAGTISKHRPSLTRPTYVAASLDFSLGALTSRQSSARSLHRAVQEAKLRRNNLGNEVNENVSEEVGALESVLEDQEKERESLLAQYAEIAPKKASLDDENKALLVQQQVVRDGIRDHDGKRSDAQGLVEQAVQQRLKAQNDQKHWAQKMTDEQNKVAQAKENEEVTRVEFTVSQRSLRPRIAPCVSS
jgi:hypothetical protein